MSGKTVHWPLIVYDEVTGLPRFRTVKEAKEHLKACPPDQSWMIAGTAPTSPEPHGCLKFELKQHPEKCHCAPHRSTADRRPNQPLRNATPRYDRISITPIITGSTT